MTQPHHPAPHKAETPLRVGAVVLAAGRGQRLGNRPKCLLLRQGQPLIQHLLQALQQAGIGPTVLVLGHHAQAIETALHPGDRQGLVIAHNPTPDAGPATSLQQGLQALPERLDAVLVALADQPLIGSTDLLELVDAFRSRPAGTGMLRPRVLGLPGNPVVFDAQARTSLQHRSPPWTGQQWHNAHPDAVHWWDTPNPRYRLDVDTPEDLARFSAETGYALEWPEGLAPL